MDVRSDILEDPNTGELTILVNGAHGASITPAGPGPRDGMWDARLYDGTEVLSQPFRNKLVQEVATRVLKDFDQFYRHHKARAKHQPLDALRIAAAKVRLTGASLEDVAMKEAFLDYITDKVGGAELGQLYRE